MNTSDHSYSYHGYDQPDPPHQPLYLALILESLRSNPNTRRVLDAGCGDGNFSASLLEAGFEMHGIDMSGGGIAKARNRYQAINFVEGSIYDDLGGLCGVDCFDAIVSVEVIEHLYSPRQFVRRSFSALRPGGLLIITTPYWGYLKNLALALSNRMDRSLTPLWDGGHIKHWSYRTLRQLLLEQGFEFKSFHGAGRKVPYLWSGMMMVVQKPSPHALEVKDLGLR